MYELSLFFTIFVLLQFWNMFNAKAFNTHQSAFARMGASIGGFGVVALLILAGQYLIVTFGGKMFNVVPLSWTDWGIIFAGTSLVLWIGELVRAFTRRTNPPPARKTSRRVIRVKIHLHDTDGAAARKAFFQQRRPPACHSQHGLDTPDGLYLRFRRSPLLVLPSFRV